MKTNKMLVMLGALVVVTGAVAAPTAPADKVAEPMGQALAHTCAACHGTYGELKGEHFVPRARMNPEEVIRSMKAFRVLKRPSSIMGHIAEGYNDEQIERMAQYFASLDSGDQK